MAVVIETTLGDLTVDLFLEQRPQTCLNFLKLCKMKYYNFSLFHSIQSGFLAQTGDPTATGSGGESIWGLLEGEDKRYFTAERVPRIRHSDVGMLSMVCAGDSLVGSQFFFTLGPDLDSLDSMHCVIGVVTEGHDVLRLLNEVICDEGYRPYRDVRITHTVVLEDPFDDPKGLHAPSCSPSPSAERLVGGRIAPDEEIDETQGKTIDEINELIEDKEAKARATILEIVGDLPDADVAPPENVLFVCKLNPVTTDSDLEIIFSRFGKIVNCEIIRDRKTGDSLQYAFIEFDDKKSCESAYFKMDNVLIDDRRIHVDFSQSVSKVKYFGKGRVKHMNENDTRSIDITGDRKRQQLKDIDKKNNKEWNFANDRKKNIICNSKDRDEHRQSNRRRSRSRSRDRHLRNHDQSRRSRDRTRKSRDRSRSGDRRRRSQDRNEKEKKRYQNRSVKSSNPRERDLEKRKLKKSISQSPIREPHSSKSGNSRLKTEPKISTSRAQNSHKDNHAHDNVNNSSKGMSDSDRDENTDKTFTHYEKIGESTKRKMMSQSGHKSSDHKSETPSRKEGSPEILEKQKEKCNRKQSNLKKSESEKGIQKDRREQKTNNMKDSKEVSKNKLKAKSDKLKRKISLKKKRKHSTSSSSSDSSSTSSSSDSSSSESDSRRKRSTKKKKRNCSTSSSSSPSESSSSESDSSSDSSSTSSSSEEEVRKKIKSAKTKNTPGKKSKTNKKKT